ncbi:conserved hypothetical protein [Pediculus humanus corporis]|uniref:Beta-catenin-interacting ICAT domain-containing protein n=1 Tax=Pediculus humanus subsp. corporis TaxID=121224 RepID=E0VFH2_PEDHC|nr:uncharacterized protein Phum_PHUM157170 [Pediculus humanus corporis]EEB12128.1 conserved hypothetical protein [Pediculus humanus corporis]
MGSRGQEETKKLRENLESQLERLIQQLADIEEVKNEMDQSEYNDIKEETLEQLKEFNERLSKMISGNMTLVDQLGLMQLATQAAISEAFSTPEVIRMFSRREPKQLRQRLFEIERDFKLGQISEQQFNKCKKEFLTALKQLNENLNDEEIKFLNGNKSVSNNALFEKVTEESDKVEAVVKQVAKEALYSEKTIAHVPG